MKLYLIGSLRNDRVPKLARNLREILPGVEVFDDWYAAGPEADDYWKAYEQERGRSYEEALSGYAARHVFEFDKHHLDTSTHALLVLPAGKSGHMELMYAKYGVGARTAILLDPDDVRWDVMYQFCDVLSNDGAIREWFHSTVDRGPVGAERSEGWGGGRSNPGSVDRRHSFGAGFPVWDILRSRKDRSEHQASDDRLSELVGPFGRYAREPGSDSE